MALVANYRLLITFSNETSARSTFSEILISFIPIPTYSQLLFYGGSALAHCFDLQRLSEDLDFIDETKKIAVPKLAKDLEEYFSNATDLPVKTTVQKFRIYLKFPSFAISAFPPGKKQTISFSRLRCFPSLIFVSITQLKSARSSSITGPFSLRCSMHPPLWRQKSGNPFPQVEKTDKQGNTDRESERPGLL